MFLNLTKNFLNILEILDLVQVHSKPQNEIKSPLISFSFSN